MFTKLIKLHNDAYLKNQILTHNHKSEINNTFIFSHEMSSALIYRPLKFCLLMQHTRPCYIVDHDGTIMRMYYISMLGDIGCLSLVFFIEI